MREWFMTLQGVNLAIWGVIFFGMATIFHVTDPEKIVLALGGGLMGYISGYSVGKHSDGHPDEAAEPAKPERPSSPAQD
ncbi:MAG: hypothetical protein LLG06_12390 [Desulfobacteraceae bacterium]|nr:hypothetical protein [Desulfobacteraceae bacterium]